MAGKDPAVLFYTSDFLSGVSLMTMKERGQYITLLCLQRERGHMTAAEMQRAVGKLSDEVRSKFAEDEDGKLYNERMEQEIEKRKAHSRRQRENVLKRWNKPNGDVGTSDGNTMVLPLGNGNGNHDEREESLISLGEVPTTPQSPPPPIAEVLLDYRNRINASASPACLDELQGFAEVVGPEVCKRAFDVALDCKKTTWPYIRAILRDKVARGVKCLADWDALEQTYQAQRRSEKPAGHKVPYGSAGQGALDELERDALDRLLKGGA